MISCSDSGAVTPSVVCPHRRRFQNEVAAVSVSYTESEPAVANEQLRERAGPRFSVGVARRLLCGKLLFEVQKDYC
jgi:hypothetical protein